jgi:hypothetical protein
VQTIIENVPMKERKFTREELGYIQALGVVQFGEGELIATRVPGQKLHNLEFKADEGRTYFLKAEDMMEMFPTDPFYTTPTFWMVAASLLCIGIYFYVG